MPTLATECAKNPGYMLESCKASCRVCKPDGTMVHAPAPIEKDS